MTLLGFTKLLPKLLNGTKTQTIRKPRKHPLKVGETVQIYWKLRTKQCKRLGEGTIIKIERKCIANMTNQDAVLDGFGSLQELNLALQGMHPDCNEFSPFDIITWKWRT
jgi:hypothetical protein